MIAFDADNFRSDNCVKDLVLKCVGGQELQQKKAEIQCFAEQTSSALKKHVYENYMQFIETAREISHLESEMYQLSHLLIEQRNLLNVLKDNAVPNNRKNIVEKLPENEEEEDNADPEETLAEKKIKAIKKQLEGYPDSFDNKIYIHDGNLAELDASDPNRPISLMHLFLFTDTLIISKISQEQTLHYVTQYNVRKTAMTNVKHYTNVRNGINVIAPDGINRIFQCKTMATKNEWLEKFDAAIKYNPFKSKKGPAPLPPPLLKQMSKDRQSILSESISIDETTNEIPVAPDFILFAPEEIEVLIAQRHFENALAVVQECTEYFAKEKKIQNYNEHVEKIKSLKNHLSVVLLRELSSTQSRSLQATLRASRRVLKLLAEMGMAREACGTLLRVCTIAIRNAQRQARRNNLAVSDVFFCDLAQVACEFLRAFSSQSACVSALVVWSNLELQYFASQLIKHYLTKGTQLELVANCVAGVREPCANLKKIGLDLSYHMEGLLRNPVENLLKESRHRMMESIGRTEESWQPYNLQTKSNLKNTLRDLENLGIDMTPQVTGDTWINLTQSTVNFCRHYLTITEQCGVIAMYESLKSSAESLMIDLLVVQYNVRPGANISTDLNFVARNNKYLTDSLLPIAISKFEKLAGAKSEICNGVQLQLRSPPVPKPRSVYKTDVL